MVRSSGAGREGVCDIDGGLVQVEGLREGLKSLKAEVRRGSMLLSLTAWQPAASRQVALVVRMDEPFDK